MTALLGIKFVACKGRKYVTNLVNLLDKVMKINLSNLIKNQCIKTEVFKAKRETPYFVVKLTQLFFKKNIFMDLVKFLAVSMILFLLGIWGIFLNRKNIIIMLMSIELMLLAVNLNFLLFSVYLDDLIGQLFALLVLTVAAAESAIGLALLVVYYRVRGTIAVEFINLMKG